MTFKLTSPPDNAPGVPCPMHTSKCKACGGTGVDAVEDEDEDEEDWEEYECEECNGEGTRLWSWRPDDDIDATCCLRCGTKTILDDWSDDDTDDYPICRACAVKEHAKDCGCGRNGWS